MKIVCIIQARMSSTRLPGKVLLPIAGKPMLWYVVKRVHQASSVDEVVVASTTEKEDDQLLVYCKKEQFSMYRGSLGNVLDRYYQTAIKFKADSIVRVTSDCPLIDGTLIDRGFQIFHEHKCDYVSNTVERTYPRGFDFEIFTFQALETAWKKAPKEPELEHVTPYIWRNHPNDFKIKQVTQPVDKSAYRITVDTPEDFAVIKILIEKFDADKKNYQEIIKILDEHPEISTLNKHIEQKQYGK